MNLNQPASDVLGENTARVLHRLAVLGEGASGRRIQELARIANLRTVQRILVRLEAVGLVDVHPIGRANRYSLNRDHILWKPIEILLEMPARVEEQLQRIVADVFGSHMRHAIMYGSFARGTAGIDSDIDVLLVWADDVPSDARVSTLAEAAERTRRLTGNDAQFLAVTGEELTALIDAKDPLVTSLLSDGRALSEGTDIHQLFRTPKGPNAAER